jgi:uncharacterized heparinase superfamily protein
MLRRYYHTLRYLKPVQIASRIRQRLHRPRPDLRSPPPLRPVSGQWCMPCRRERSMLGPANFRFLNEARQLRFPEAWNASGPSKLWLYNLHYFDDLNAASAESRQAWHEVLVERWIAENPPAFGNGWEPYPLSLRMVNWIKWALAGNRLSPQAVHSLAVQVRQLRRSLEFHLLGNHLFANAKALVFAGLFFAGEEAQKWLAQGTTLLAAQTREQILADGGHFELSPMYHALTLEDLLDLANLSHAYRLDPPDGWRDAVARMFDWLTTMCHPDGGIAFFNDAALGVAPSLADLERYAARLGIARESGSAGSRLLKASGYARLERDQAVVYADVAAVGPDHLPAHGHADSLSFELSIHGQRVVVNSGTSVYGTGPERQRQRGTAAHNTVRLDGADSSEVWAGFRVARRARVRVERFDAQSDPVLQAVHDGYRQLDGHPLHRRIWTMGPSELQVEDAIEGHREHLVELFFHLHPALHLESSGVCAFSAVRKDGTFLLEFRTDSRMLWQVEAGCWHPGFGLCEGNVCLRGEYRGALPLRLMTRLVWQV